MEIVQHFCRSVRHTYQASVAHNRHCVVRSPNIQRVQRIDMRTSFKVGAGLPATGFAKAVRTMAVVGMSEPCATEHSMPMTREGYSPLKLAGLGTFFRTPQSFVLSAHRFIFTPSSAGVQYRLASSPILRGGQNSGTNITPLVVNPVSLQPRAMSETIKDDS